jgi:murein DD-endopeptidase MepM/ murein hydrolase activator NlpD
MSARLWKWAVGVSMAFLFSLGLFFFWPEAELSKPELKQEEVTELEIRLLPRLEFGLEVDSLEVIRHRIRSGETFSGILDEYGVNRSVQLAIVNESGGILDPRLIKAGKVFHVYRDTLDSISPVKHLVYQQDDINYVVIDLSDSLLVQNKQKEVKTVSKTLSTTIRTSLYDDLLRAGGDINLAYKVSDLYAWSIDFFRLQTGDRLAIVYEEKYVDDSVKVGVGRILMSDFQHSGRDFEAYRYERDGKLIDYYDENGKSLRKAFLKAPLDFFRISSRYNPRRFHPVLKRVKPHLGTDYAAPQGTPIRTTADGVIDKAGYTSGNGNYVKVRHNSVYSTQYLHMSKIKSGIRAGVAIKQGDIIGYVGSTGLATGPHVCYRFWKNGKQVDPLKEELPEAQAIEAEWLPDYKSEIDTLRPILKEMLQQELLKEMDEEGPIG